MREAASSEHYEGTHRERDIRGAGRDVRRSIAPLVLCLALGGATTWACSGSSAGSQADGSDAGNATEPSAMGGDMGEGPSRGRPMGGNEGTSDDAGVDTQAPPLPDAAPVVEPDAAGMPTCNVTVAQHDDEGAQHVALCSRITWATNPPNSGSHYDNWAAYGVYDSPVPWGFLVHNLEHGAIVFSYNCPNGCMKELNALKAMADTLSDPTCKRPERKPRYIIVPNPNLDVRFAASSWRRTLKADCFVEAAFRTFFNQRVGQAPEPNECGDGIRPNGMWCQGNAP